MLSKSDKSNSIWFTSSFVFGSVMNFIIFSITFKAFEANEFGVFIFLSSLLLIGNSLDLGFGIASIREVSQARERNDINYIKRYYPTFFLVYAVLALLISLCFLAYYGLFIRHSELVSSVPNLNSDLIFLLLVLSFIFHYLAGYVRCFFEGFLEYELLSKISILVVVINFAAILPIYILGLNIYFLCLVNLLVGMCSFFITFAVLRFKFDFLKLNSGLMDLKIFQSLTKYGMKLQASIFIGSFADPVMKYLIGTNLSPGFISYFESAKKVVNFTNGLITTSQRAVFVKLGEARQNGTITVLVNRGLPSISRFANVYSVVVYGILNPATCLFIYKWFNNIESVLIYLMFSMSFSLINFAGVLYNVLMVDGRGLVLIIMQSFNIVCIFVFLNTSLVLFDSSFGILGYFVSTVINIAFVFYLVGRHSGLRSKEYLDAINYRILIILNVLLMLQIVLIYNFEESMYKILSAMFILYLILFRNQLMDLARIGKPYLLRFLKRPVKSSE